MLRIDLPVEHYLYLLKNRVPFSFSRWGDGEFAAIFGVGGENCDGHQYFYEMGVALAKVVEEQSGYYYGILPVARKVFSKQIERFVQNRNISMPFYGGKVFLESLIEGKIHEVIHQIRNRNNTIYVGPTRIEPVVSRLLGVDHFIEVPLKDSFLQINDIESEIKNFIAGTYKMMKGVHSHFTVLYSCGPMAKIIVHRLNRWQPITQIDFGSMWDGMAGFNTRKYMNAIDWERKILEIEEQLDSIQEAHP